MKDLYRKWPTYFLETRREDSIVGPPFACVLPLGSLSGQLSPCTLLRMAPNLIETRRMVW